MFAQNYITTSRRARYERHGRSLFQITRCAQNRLPREQPAPAPDSERTAIALRSPYCLANVPRTPQRSSRPHTSAHTRPIRAPAPRKKRHSRASPVPSPAPSNPADVPSLPHVCAISPHQSAPNPAISPALWKYKYIRAILARARDRPRGPENRPSHGEDPGIRIGVPCGRPVAAPPPVLICHAVPRLCPKIPALAVQIRAGPPAAPATRRTECRRNEQISPSREACPRGNGKREQRCRGVPGNLNQVPYLRKPSFLRTICGRIAAK